MTVLDRKKLSSFSSWSWDADLTDDAGLVLSQVAHAGYSFATEMRLVKIWVSNGSPTLANSVSRELLLGSADLPPITPTISEVPSPTVKLIRPYLPSLEVMCTFQTSAPVLGGQSEPFTVEQSYVFTDYGRTPVHEPGAIINAARCYPLLRFSYPGGQQGPPHLSYIRFDYRFDISIDASLSAQTKGRIPLIDQVGVFQDTESQFVPTISNLFARAEKPVHHELIGQGLQYGLKSDWDNIHQWGGQDPLPATPGAFHAAHNHWRWGASSTTGQRFPPLAGAPHFAGLGGPGGPLIDPRIPHQSLRFALTGRGGDNKVASIPEWDPARHPSTANFDDLFTFARAPAEIKDGAVITQWLSVEVQRDVRELTLNRPWEGTVFVHGYFFSHEHEDLGRLGLVPGLLAQPVGRLKDPLKKEAGVEEKNGWVRR